MNNERAISTPCYLTRGTAPNSTIFANPNNIIRDPEQVEEDDKAT